MKSFRFSALPFVLLALIVMLPAVAGCGTRTAPSPDSHPEELSVRASVSSSVGSFDDTYIVDEHVGLLADAPQATRAEFFFKVMGEGEDFDEIGADEDGSDGWKIEWRLPTAGKVYEVDVRVFGEDEKAANATLRLLWPGAENGFELVSPDFEVKLASHVPEYFLPVGWIDQETILGQTGTNLIRYNVADGSWRPLKVPAWQSVLSPDGQLIALQDESGISVVQSDGSGRQLIWSREEAGGSDLGVPVWSPDGKKLLLSSVEEWDASYSVFDIEFSTVTPVTTRLGDYFLASPAVWAMPEHILFTTRASRTKDGKAEYTMGYRQDIAILDLNTDEFRLITDASDGEFYSVSGYVDGQVLIEKWFLEPDEVSHKEKREFYLAEFSGDVSDNASKKALLSLEEVKLPFAQSAYLIARDRVFFLTTALTPPPGSESPVRAVYERNEEGVLPLGFIIIGDHFTGFEPSLDGAGVVFGVSRNVLIPGESGACKATYETYFLSQK
jgi:hypothetical protein